MSPKSSAQASDEYSISDQTELRDWIKHHPEYFQPGNLILLSGPMGAGKTTFVSILVGVLGGKTIQVSSPTFSLHHVYQVGGLTIDHMDLYRLENDDDLVSSGFHEIIENQENLCLIEWAQRIDESFFKDLRSDVYWIELTAGSGTQRYLTVKKI